ncbi:hypothetical protein QVD17_08251 [Tagetes erecta]|uniref:SWIM-type domain-containing protein n=1 Tax=Tagetes erecta TaxID=13708 RepID=A0AAD8L4B3_TARER|nr:hypothetical protein QVD17_08251 [Tagetes erecta]
MPYTKHAFAYGISPLSLVFQDQLAMAIQYSAWKENDTSFIVKHYKAERLHKVVWDGKMAECTCKNFEVVGILCRHALSVLLHTGCFKFLLVIGYHGGVEKRLNPTKSLSYTKKEL